MAGTRGAGRRAALGLAGGGQLRRRQFLALVGGAGATALLAACGGGVDVSTPTTAPRPTPT